MTAERSETDATQEHPQGEREGWRERVKVIRIAHHKTTAFQPRPDRRLEPFVKHLRGGGVRFRCMSTLAEIEQTVPQRSGD